MSQKLISIILLRNYESESKDTSLANQVSKLAQLLKKFDNLIDSSTEDQIEAYNLIMKCEVSLILYDIFSSIICYQYFKG